MRSTLSRSLQAWTVLAAVLFGCQCLIGSAVPQRKLMVVLPSDAEDAALRNRFLQGYAVGGSSVEDCGVSMPAVRWHGLKGEESPVQQLSRISNLQLVVAPPSADVESFAALSRQKQWTVVLPYQRGASLSTLRGLEERAHLWPIVPSRQDDLRATVRAAISAGWGRAMVVEAPGAIEANAASTFVDLYRAAGGLVESYESVPVQRVDPDDTARFNRFRDDMNWSWTATMVVADRPDGPLAARLRQEQQRGALGGGAPLSPNWVWLTEAESLTSLPEVPWRQLGLEHSARGKNWSVFRDAFRQRWHREPDLLAAAGYDTARLLALVDAAPVPRTAEGEAQPLGWIDPAAASVGLCEALHQRQLGQSLRVKAAASDFRLQGGRTPSGEASAKVLSS